MEAISLASAGLTHGTLTLRQLKFIRKKVARRAPTPVAWCVPSPARLLPPKSILFPRRGFAVSGRRAGSVVARARRPNTSARPPLPPRIPRAIHPAIRLPSSPRGTAYPHSPPVPPRPRFPQPPARTAPAAKESRAARWRARRSRPASCVGAGPDGTPVHDETSTARGFRMRRFPRFPPVTLARRVVGGCSRRLWRSAR